MTEPTLTEQLATVTAEARRYITADDAIGDVCLAAGFDCESTLEAVQAMAARLVEVAAERNTWMRNFDDVAHRLADLQERIDSAPVWFAVISSRLDAPERVVPDERTANDIHNMIPGTCGVTRVRLVRDEQPGD